MVRLGVKELRAPHVHVFVLVLVFLGTPVVRCAGQVYVDSDMVALQTLWAAWNNSLKGLVNWPPKWNDSYQPYPCGDFFKYRGFAPRSGDWLGVQCLSTSDCQTPNGTVDNRNCSSLIVGLSLDNAQIVGTLPPTIGDFSTMTTLELIGNPGLVGPLPDTLNKTNLFVIDLHDNGFSGGIPDFGIFNLPKTLDLSSNSFNGSFPDRQIQSMVFLEKLNLSRNNFEGEITSDAFHQLKLLVHLDISSNRLSGALPFLFGHTNLQILDLSNNQFTGDTQNVYINSMDSIQNVDLSNNQLTGALPILTSHTLRNVNLSRNALNGPISTIRAIYGPVGNGLSVLDLSQNQFTDTLTPSSFEGLGLFGELYLDHNKINGILNINRLYELGLLSKNSGNSTGGLRILSLKNNSIDAVIYDDNVIFDIRTIIRLEGNPYCNHIDNSRFRQPACNSDIPSTNLYRVPSVEKSKVVIITLPVVISTALLIGLVATLYKYRKYKQYSQLEMQRKFEEFEVKPTIFSYNQLRIATRGFHSSMKLGQGAFGAVYKGIFPNGNIMAVKQLFATTSQGIDEFLNEVVLLTGMKHRNLVNLKGCCIQGQQRLLVYEYVDNHDIDKLLLAGVNKIVLSWPVRFNICLGVARGLHYLHALAHPKIIHRDIKASNILLAKNNEAKVADFGLAKLFSDEQSCIMTEHIAGTKGYLAPEYASFGQLSDKVDVFSFGVLCLEVLSGRRNINNECSPEKIYLCKWAWDLLQDEKLMDLIDPLIILQDVEELEAHRLINIALLCIQYEADERPSMERVVAMLQGETEGKVMPLKAGDEEQYLENMRLFAVGKGDLSSLNEEDESSFLNSIRQSEGWSKDNDSNGSMLELSEISSG